MELERFNPRNRGVFTANHIIGDFRFLFRASFYDDWVDAPDDDWGDPEHVVGGTSYSVVCGPSNDGCYDGDWVIDLEAAYTFNQRYSIVVGAQNAFDADAPLDNFNTAGPQFSNNSGEKYTESSHWGINGGFWYLRFRADFD